MNLKKNPQAVCVIIFDEERVLLLKRRDIPVWVLPGGGIEERESPEEAALRETLEETGCTVQMIRKIAEYLPANRLTQFTHFFECKIKEGEIKTGPETLSIQFFPIKNLPKDLAPPYALWIKDAISFFPHTIKKRIEGASYWLLLKLLFLHPFLVGRFLLTKLNIHINKK